MTKKKLYDFKDHPEHQAQIPAWTARWNANAMSTVPMTDADRVETRRHIKGLYEAAGLKPPPNERIVFVRDPFVMRFAAGYAAWIWWCRKHPKNKLSTELATELATRLATELATEQATEQAT